MEDTIFAGQPAGPAALPRKNLPLVIAAGVVALGILAVGFIFNLLPLERMGGWGLVP